MQLIRAFTLLLILQRSLSVSAQTRSAATTKSTAYDATITITLAHPIGKISPLIYGQYLEHVQQEDHCIYPSIWDQTSSKSEKSGLRLDTIRSVASLHVPVVRWPGGCFADVYHWEDAIGPPSARLPKPNLHWGGTESNRFGTDEFLRWCRLIGATPYINVNLGSGSLDEALRWLGYCNDPPDTVQGRRRAKNGQTLPYNVRFWGIGNETWGPWETGHTDATSYSRALSSWSRAMRTRSPGIKILGVGSEQGNNQKWDTTVLQMAGADIDLLTMHMYGVSTSPSNAADDAIEFDRVAYTPTYLESRMRHMISLIDKNTSSSRISGSAPGHRVDVAIDEWNVRHFINGKQHRDSPRDLQDAIFTGGMLNAMIRQSPRVAMANYVFLVNGNGTLLVNDNQIVTTPLAYVFKQYAQRMKGTALEITQNGPLRIPPPPLTGHPGRPTPSDYSPVPQPVLDVAAALNPDGTIAISLVNRDRIATGTIEIRVPQGYHPASQWLLTDKDLHAANTFAVPNSLIPKETHVDSNEIVSPPHSVMLITCRE